MLDSLKDMYISYPFMPLADPPDWFAHIKDLRAVVTLDAMNFISKYKNWNSIRAWLLGVDMHGKVATIRVLCGDISETPEELQIPVYNWTDGAPGSQSYMLIDSELSIDNLPESGYELQPDVLVFMQKAPKLTAVGVEQSHEIAVTRGYNVSVSSVSDGVLFYGAPGTGEGVAAIDDPIVGPVIASRISPEKQGLGITNLNGMINDVRIDGTFPVEVPQQDIFGGTVHVVYKDV